MHAPGFDVVEGTRLFHWMGHRYHHFCYQSNSGLRYWLDDLLRFEPFPLQEGEEGVNLSLLYNYIYFTCYTIHGFKASEVLRLYQPHSKHNERRSEQNQMAQFEHLQS
jgi:hypothetical protein